MSAPHQSSEITLRLEAAAEAALRARFPQEAQQGLEAALAAALDPRGLAPDVFPANCFAAGGAILNRHNNSRDDAAFISGRLNDPETRYLVFVHLSPLQDDKQRITFHARSSKLVTSLMDTDSVKSDVVLLGQLTGADAPTTARRDAHSVVKGDWIAAVNVDALPDDCDLASLGLHEGDMRTLALSLVDSQMRSPWQASALAQARSTLEFVRRHRFCGSCGRPTAVAKGGIELTCAQDAGGCGTSWFPRSDPVAIMLIIDPTTDRALLGRQARWPAGRWSALAGFMEHGESIEDGVRRETVEESGVLVGRCRYHSSQPWPWPYSLMLGCIAEAADPTITVDKRELEDARWFTRDEIKDMLAQSADDSGLRLAPPGTIAHELCRAFAEHHPICNF